MATSKGRGLFQKSKPNGVWYVRKAVPQSLRAGLGGKLELIKSLGTNDYRTAERLAADVLRQWDAEIAHARMFEGKESLEPVQALQAIEAWRRARCTASVGDVSASAAQLNPSRDGELVVGSMPAASVKAKSIYREQSRSPLRIDLEGTALAFFDRFPGASRELAMPWDVAMRIGRLQAATRDASTWRDVEGFDAQMDDALAAGGATGALSPSLRGQLREPFAVAWLEVCRHEEAQRQRAAAFLRAAHALTAKPDAIVVEPSRTSYVPREGDRTVKELIAAFRAERSATYGEESTDRKYHHIFAALEEALTPNKPLRAITREDARKVRDLLRSIPAHMGKRYAKLTLTEAIDKAAEDDAPLLAPNTVNSYLSNLTAMLNWAVKESWIDANPATSITLKNLPKLKRRGFTTDELKLVFANLADERKSDSWRFWVPALALYTGARLNEICQLKVEDLQIEGGIEYLKFTLFDVAGRRDEDKRLKTQSSARNVPLHSELVAAKFPDFVRGLKSERIFADLKPGPSGGYSHDVSKWFGSFLDRIGLKDPAVVFHSFRHGFRDACDVAAIPDSLTKALGGWASESVSDKYGRRDFVPVLDREVKKIAYGDFKLNATAG